jgi:signal transduction histidine kinase
MWSYLFLGIGLGLLAAIPLAGIWGRRTERRVRQLERRTRSAERLAELGTLTGGLAHEIKNPLSTVGLNVQLLQEDVQTLAQDAGLDESHIEGLGRVQRRLESLRRETQRLRDILEDFLRFAGRVELDTRPTDIHTLIDELTDFFEPQARDAGVNLRTQLSANPSVVPADAALLKQALLNLLINATQAMTKAREESQPHGGADELIVRTECGKTLDGDELRIHVTDTGPGMAGEVVQKIFQPYYSTKRGGTGLGLPTSRRIVEEHGGHVTAHSEPGQGTDFTLTLPAKTPESDAE